MQANELRLGNFVWNDTQNIPVVVDIKIISEQLYRQKTGNGMWKPITLTEEWLKKLGFEDDGFYEDIHTYRIEVNGIYMYSDSSNDYSTLEAHGKSRMPIIKYVHQLQNLYFALTGEELSIK